MIDQFIADCRPGKTSLAKLYQQFKLRPLTEGYSRLAFMNGLIRAGAPVRQEGKQIYVALTLEKA
jgi:hypothetical protein